MIDCSIVKVHRHGQGAKGDPELAIGTSKGGMTTKILALVDALGNLVGLCLLPGQRHDICGVEPLIKDWEFGVLLADKAFDADWLVKDLTEWAVKWLSRRAVTVRHRVSMTRRCISDGIWLKISSVN